MIEADGVALILDTLSTQTLRDLVANSEIEVEDRRVRSRLQAALGDHYEAVDELLADLTRPILHALCDEFELPVSGSATQLRERLGRFLSETSLGDDTDAGRGGSSRVPSIGTTPDAPVGPWGVRLAGAALDPTGSPISQSSQRDDVMSSSADSSSRWLVVLGVGAAVMAVGRFVNELDFLYPSRGNVIASGRRRNNPLAIAFKGISVVFGGALIALFILASIIGGIAGSFHH